MAYLEVFTDVEKEFLASLPYRAGLWISHCDDTGLESWSDDQEQAMLESVIKDRSQGMFESAFVHEVMEHACFLSDRWREWDDKLDTVLDDCKKATKMMKGRIEGRDITAYKKAIVKVATKVALAYREFDQQTSLVEKLIVGLRATIDSIIGILLGRRFYSNEYRNISPVEEKALAKITDALRENEFEDI